MLFRDGSTPPKSKAIVALERDLETAQKRQEKLAGQLDRAALAAERAASERRALLIEHDSPDRASLAKAEAACRVADEARAGLEDAARALAERIRDLEANLAEQRDRASRNAAAEQLERRALEIDVATGDFRDALAALAERYRALIAAMRESGPIKSTSGTPIAPELAALAVLDAGIRKFEPHLVPRSAAFGEPPAPTDPLAVAQALVSGPLRTKAEAIRSGSAPIPAAV